MQKLSKEEIEQSATTFQKKQLLIREHVEFVVTSGQIYQTKTFGFQNTQIT